MDLTIRTVIIIVLFLIILVFIALVIFPGIKEGLGSVTNILNKIW